MKKALVFWQWLLLLCGAAVLTPFAPVQGQHTLKAGAGSWISYTLEHPLHTVQGLSDQVTSQLETGNDGHRVVRVTVSVPVRSFDSGNRTRDKDMRKVTEAELYPLVRFTSTQILEQEGQLEVTGPLTLHGITRTIRFKARQQGQEEGLLVEGAFAISLDEFGVKRPSLLGLKVKDQLLIRFRVRYGPPEK